MTICQSILKRNILSESGLSENRVDYLFRELEKNASTIQTKINSIRAQPLENLFRRLSRIARQSAEMVGKSLEIQIEGGGTEIDKLVLDRVVEPLTHVIRNSVDHGIEPPDVRIERSKPSSGQLAFRAAQADGRITIEICDDGNGIDIDRVRQKATEKGLISAGKELSQKEVIELIFHPGFSTAAAVSELSGRGVGMDVVRREIKDLGGDIIVSSEAGKGSSFKIGLPMTLAVQDGLLVETNGEFVVIPSACIVETQRITAIVGVEVSGALAHMKFGCEQLVVKHLRGVLGMSEPAAADLHGVILILKLGERGRIGLVVDRIIEHREFVVKGLDYDETVLGGYSSVTILGNGQAALILDANQIAKKL